jgi:ABC-type sugar transport system ATPase subunit
VTAGHLDRPLGPVVLSVDQLAGRHVHGLTLSVRAGQIVGLSGVLGSGRGDLNSLVFGARRPASGRITLAGDRLGPGDMTAAIERGAAFVPADRHRLGAVMTMSMRENHTLPALRGLRQPPALPRSGACCGCEAGSAHPWPSWRSYHNVSTQKPESDLRR